MRNTPPPNDVDVERSVLGAMLLNEDAILKVLDIFGERSDIFYVEAHTDIYNAMIDLYRDRKPLDIVVLCKRLADLKLLKKSGGPTYIAGLMDAVPTSSNAEYYANILMDYWKRRVLIQACTRIAGEAYVNQDKKASDLAIELLSETGTAMEAGRSTNMVHMTEAFHGLIEEIQFLRNRTMDITGATTGMAHLDRLLLGLRPGTLNIIGARPSVGKSAISVNMANSAALAGHPVLFFSLEMSRTALARRFMTINSMTSYRSLTGKDFLEIQNKKISDAVGKMANAKVYVDDSTRLSVYNFVARSRRFAALHEGMMPIIFLDYLTLCEFTESKTKKKYELIGEFTRECKLLAGELQCPIVVLCQLSREAEKLDDPFRAMGTLRESGNIEADADTISIALQQSQKWLTARGKACGIDDEGSLINFAVIKNREGPVGLCPLVFDKGCQYITSLDEYEKKWKQDNEAPEQEELL